MIRTIGSLCVMMALALDAMSYWKQVAKTIRERKSSQVSTSAYLYKIGKVLFSMIGLAVYANYVGLGMEMFMLTVYIASLFIIAKFKPKGWRLF